MKRAAKWVVGLFSGVVLLIVALGVHTWYFKPLRIDWFYGRVFAAFALESPETLSSMRLLPPALDFHSDKLDDLSAAHDDKVFADIGHALATLKQYDRAALDRDGQLSYDTLAFYLQSQVDGAAYRRHDFPVNQLQGVQSAMPSFMIETHQVTDLSEANNYIARLGKIPRKFDQLIDGLTLRQSQGIIAPRFAIEKVLVQMQDFSAQPAKNNPLYVSFQDKLAKIPATDIDSSTRASLLAQTEQAITSSVYPAYRKLIATMQAQLAKASGNNGAWSLPDGDAYYAWCVRRHTTTTMTPQQVHDLGLAEVARVSAEMDVILQAQGLTKGTVGARVLQLANDPAQRYPNTAEGKQAMLARYQDILDDINKGIGAGFDVRPKMGVEVRAVPEFSQATAPGAYYEDGAFDGSRPGVFYANMRDPGETPKFGMRTLAYHEGIPGHHFQVAIAQELQDVPFFRRVIPFTAYQEGWALYAERLAFEMGFERDPLDSLGRLQEEMLRATRLVVDSGIHYKRWTREQAITYMIDNTGKQEGEVVAEVERYIVDPGQALAYKTGMLKLLALREHAKQELGPKFNLKQFHNEVLTHGALPLTILEGVVNDWIEKRKKV